MGSIVAPPVAITSYVPSKPLLWTNQIQSLLSLAFVSNKMVAPSQEYLIDNQDLYCNKTGLTSYMS